MNFERLRELVLERAIRGELVPQNCDEDCVKEGTSEDVPFDVPASWGWVQLADLSVKRKTVDPMTIDEPNVELWSIPAYDSGAAQEICPKDIGSSKKIVLEGDVLLSKIVPHIKRAWVVTESGRNLPKLASTEWLVYGSGRLIPEFLALQFRSPYFRKKMLENISGMGSLKRANPSSLAKVFLPVPPLLEQVRIVEKIKEAFAEIDRAEKAYEELQTLAGVLRGQILQEAIEGKLVPQLAEEGVVEQIGGAPEEVPFEIPESWKWCHMKGITQKIHYGFTASAANAGNAKLLRITDIQDGRVNWDTVPFCDAPEKKLASCKLGESDVVIARTGGTIGKSFLLIDVSDVAVFASYLIRLIPCAEVVNPKYLMVFLNSPEYWKQLKAMSQGTGQPNVNAKSLSTLLLPLPPLDEQARIVAKVEELLKHVDALSGKLFKSPL